MKNGLIYMGCFAVNLVKEIIGVLKQPFVFCDYGVEEFFKDMAV